MPHAEPKSKSTMGEPIVNGEKPHYKSLSHLTSYPVISDSITTFKNNKYGAKSLQYADEGYQRFAKPFLPYLSGPYSYVAPFVEKADTLIDSGLSKVDERFPVLKKDTKSIQETIVDTASRPLRLASDVQQRVLDTYGSEYKKFGGNGLIAGTKAAISTGLVISQESLAWLSSVLGAKKEQAQGAVNKANH
ncbi:hypothetical protein VTN31DRAFT_1323 [Thermomyces dupontii]|uniref:uncharacterized protein n=1 Tax=Talaromyces thermophilus TaxID=28565 RepID=UPI0037443142